MNGRKKQSKLVVMEGMDGRGKTTHVRRLTEFLRDRVGLSVKTVKFPRYDTTLGKLIGWMLRSGAAVKHPTLFQTLNWVDKLSFQVFTLPFVARSNDVVLVDRWKASSWVYGVSSHVAAWTIAVTVRTLHDPFMTVLLSGSGKRTEPTDSYERDDKLQQRANMNYALWKCVYGRNNNVVEVNTDGPLKEAACLVSTAVVDALRHARTGG